MSTPLKEALKSAGKYAIGLSPKTSSRKQSKKDDVLEGNTPTTSDLDTERTTTNNITSVSDGNESSAESEELELPVDSTVIRIPTEYPATSNTRLYTNHEFVSQASHSQPGGSRDDK
jgi:hypothetical protein